MKLNEQTIDVESEGFTSTGFSLEVDDPQIIEILTQKIYTDPFVFPRELMANAIDGGGIFELVLPDSLSPQWEVEDKGAGMSHEFMMTNYTKIFHSTKRKDNNNIGGFGHGRLSPLAYTDSYTVRSRFVGKDGTIMEGNYVVYRGPNKVPQISCVSMIRSEVQETGVRVVVPVAAKDISTLVKKTNYFGQYLTPTPPGVTAVKYVFQSANGGVRNLEDNRYSHNEDAGIRIIIGGVPYPAPASQRADLSVDLFFKIGEIDVTLSRDAVNATSDTLDLIKNRLNGLIKDYQKDFKEKLDKLPTVYEKYAAYTKAYGECSYGFRSAFMSTLSAPSTLPINDLLGAAKKDFAVHMIHSDVDRHQWDGMDPETKSYRSLNSLRIFMLNDKCQIERRDGRTSNQDIACADLFRKTASDKDTPVIVPFSVPLPYGQGQIKKIKEVMAKKLGEIRTAGKVSGHNNLQAILIQYEDKADVQAILDKIMSGLKATDIDTGQSAGNKMTRYVPVLRLDSNGARKVAMSENVLGATKNLVYLERDANFSDSSLADIVYATQKFFPSVAPDDSTYIIVNANDKKYLPQDAQLFKPLLIKAIAKDYGYEYTSGLFDKDKVLKAELSREGSYAILNNKVKGKNLTLAGHLLTEAALMAKKPKLKAMLEGFVAINGATAGTPTSKDTSTEMLRNQLATLINFRDRYKFLTTADLPAPTKKVAAVTNSVSQTELANFYEKYYLLRYVATTYDYKYYGYPSKTVESIVEYLTKV